MEGKDGSGGPGEGWTLPRGGGGGKLGGLGKYYDCFGLMSLQETGRALRVSFLLFPSQALHSESIDITQVYFSQP